MELKYLNDSVIKVNQRGFLHVSPTSTFQESLKKLQKPVKTIQKPVVKTFQNPVKSFQNPVKTIQEPVLKTLLKM